MLRVTDFAFVILNEVKNLTEAKTDVKYRRLVKNNRGFPLISRFNKFSKIVVAIADDLW